MTQLAALIAGISLAGALVLSVHWWRHGSVQPQPARTRVNLGQRWSRITRRPAGAAGRRRDLQLLAGLVAGFVIFFFTRLPIAIPLVPGIVLVLPILLGRAPRSDVELLEALDKWVRNLSAILPMGRSVTDAIQLSRTTAPPLIQEEVRVLADRLYRQRRPEEALRQFADQLDSPEADAVVASLILSTTYTAGITQNLTGIADSLQERLKALRTIETERAKPRQTVRLVTIISALMLGAMGLLGPQFFAPYTSPLGGLLISGLLLAYVGSLVLLYRMTMPRRRARILVRTETVPDTANGSAQSSLGLRYFQ